MWRSSFPKEINTVLVDDEEIALHRFKKILAAYPMIKVVGEARDGRAAVALINKLAPDLVFLDIQMPEFTGFEVLSQLERIPMVVFVTAYEEFAIQAFEKNSLDYLLKPVEEDRLAITVHRVIENASYGQAALLKIQTLLQEVQTKKQIASTIPVKIGNKTTLVQVAEIYYFAAKDKYVLIHTRNAVHLIDYSLSFLEDRLPDEFIRVHRSYIVNKLKITEIQKYFKGGYVFVMSNPEATRLKTAESYNGIIRKKLLLP